MAQLMARQRLARNVSGSLSDVVMKQPLTKLADFEAAIQNNENVASSHFAAVR
jgi:hypothetical protein